MKSVRTRTRTTLAAGTALGLGLVGAPAFATTANAETSDAPKNIILLISDGAGYNQFDAASLYEHGTSMNQVSVDPATGSVERVPSTASQVYESYPVQVGQSHFPAGGQYVTEDIWGSFDTAKGGATDSAAAGTALGTGVKTRNGVLGFDANANRLLTVGEQAKAVGKSVGLVTSVPFNHATPAGFIAHNGNRNDYQGLATEMIDSGVDVIMGGGHPNFTDAHTTRPADYRWISQADFARVSGGNTPFTFIDQKSGFESLATAEETPEQVFGLAQVAETLQYNRPGVDRKTVAPFTDAANDVPSLDTMAAGALNVLDANDEGFFLMIEGGAVDWAGHANQTTRVVEEQVDFNRAVATVDEWVAENSSWEETLVVVTADHETGYLAGPGAAPTWTPLTGTEGQLPNVSWHSGNHTNHLVPLFAKGAGSAELAARADAYDLVRGAYLDNTDLGELIFDSLGFEYSEEGAAAGLEASIGRPSTAGALSLRVAQDGPAVFSGTDDLTAQLPEVTVSDTRNEVQSLGRGWTASGTSTDFRAGNRVIDSENLSWTPKIVASENGASAAPASTLAATAALATADRTTRVGETVVGADLLLDVPADARGGRYGSEIVLTVFPTD